MNWLTVHISKFDRAENRRQMIDQLIAEGSEQSIRYLLSFLKDKDVEVRIGAVRALGKLKATEAVKDLIVLLQDADPKVREAAIGSLAQIGDRSCIEPLIALLGDDHFEVRRRAARAMDSFSWRATTIEQRLLWAIARGDYEAAARDGRDMAIEPLIILSKEKNSPDRRLIIQALGKIEDPRAIAALCEDLHDEDPHIRVAVAETLGDAGNAEAVPALVEALQDREVLLRAAAATALRKIGDPSGVDGLISALNDEHWDVRRGAVEGLGSIRDARGVAPLLELLKDADADVRASAVKALGQIGNKQAVARLIEALVDVQVTVRQIALDALRNIDDRWELSPAAQEAIPLLQQAAQDKEYWVRNAANEVLDRLARARKSGTSTTMTVSPKVLERQASALEALVNALNDWDRDLRQAAAEALGRVADARAFEPLNARLQDEDPDVQESARKALQTMGVKSGHTTFFAKR